MIDVYVYPASNSTDITVSVPGPDPDPPAPTPPTPPARRPYIGVGGSGNAMIFGSLFGGGGGLTRDDVEDEEAFSLEDAMENARSIEQAIKGKNALEDMLQGKAKPKKKGIAMRPVGSATPRRKMFSALTALFAGILEDRIDADEQKDEKQAAARRKAKKKKPPNK